MDLSLCWSASTQASGAIDLFSREKVSSQQRMLSYGCSERLSGEQFDLIWASSTPARHRDEVTKGVRASAETLLGASGRRPRTFGGLQKFDAKPDQYSPPFLPSPGPRGCATTRVATRLGTLLLHYNYQLHHSQYKHKNAVAAPHTIGFATAGAFAGGVATSSPKSDAKCSLIASSDFPDVSGRYA